MTVKPVGGLSAGAGAGAGAGVAVGVGVGFDDGAAVAEAVDDGGAQSAGLDVADAAAMRLEPGSPRPMFDQDRWDLSGLTDASMIMGAPRKVLDFTQIADPLWRPVARTYLMARMAPSHPAVATLPHAIRSPLNPNSLWGRVEASDQLV